MSSLGRDQEPHLCPAAIWATAVPAWGPVEPSPTLLSLLPRKVCHHADCQQRHHRGPLNLCEACDSKFHSAMHYDGHVRFDLPPQGEHVGTPAWPFRFPEQLQTPCLRSCQSCDRAIRRTGADYK